MSTINLDNLDVTVPNSKLSTDLIQSQSQQSQSQQSQSQQSQSQQALPLPVEYSVSDADIQFLQKQISITDDNARILLLKNKGNYVNAIIDFYQVNYKKEESIGIAQPTITAFTLDNNHHESNTTVAGRKLNYDSLKHEHDHKSPAARTISKTYLFVNTSPDYTGFTKKKKYCTLLELINTEIIPGITISLMQSPSTLTVYELIGSSNEILEKWSMPSSGIVLCPEQIVTNSTIVDKGLLAKLNKNATQIARHSGIIRENESIIYGAYVVGNIDFN